MARRNRKDPGNIKGKPRLEIHAKSQPNGVTASMEVAEHTASSSDASVFRRVPGLTDPITRVSFMDRTGVPIPLGPNITSQFVAKGFMVLGTLTSFGWSNTANSAVNEAAKKLQIYLQRTVSNKLNFDQSDTMIYCLAMSEVYSAIIFGQRILGTVNWNDVLNVYCPDALLEAQGIDPVDLRNNIAQLEYGLNNRIAKLASMPVPRALGVMDVQASKFRTYYIEGNSPKDQMYMFAPDYFLQYAENENGSSLIPSTYDRTVKRTVTQFLSYIDSLIDAIVNNGSLREIGGVILRAFGSDQLVTLEPVPQNYVMVPIFDIVVLEQIKNATIVPAAMIDVDGFVWEQDAQTSLLYHNGQLTATSNNQRATGLILASNRILTTGTEYTTSDLVLLNSRYMTVAKPTNTNNVWELYSGTDIVTSCTAYNYSYDANFKPTLVRTAMNNVAHNAAAAMTIASARSGFKYAPMLYVPDVTGFTLTSPTIGLAYPVNVDVDNYAYVLPENLIELHDACIMSLFYIDMVVQSY